MLMANESRHWLVKLKHAGGRQALSLILYIYFQGMEVLFQKLLSTSKSYAWPDAKEAAPRTIAG